MVYLKLLAHKTAEAEDALIRFAMPDDHQEAKSRKTIRSRDNFLLARAAIRSLLYDFTGIKNWQFYTDTEGKPYIANEGCAGPAISISHSNGWVACALSEQGTIGIDIEYWKLRDFNKFSHYAFGPDECRAIERGGTAAFYRIWTLREAKAKATGESLLRGMNGKDVVTYFGSDEKWICDGWHFTYLTPHQDYSLAVAMYE